MEPDASDELWPLRTQPLQGELFSSWLVRVARCYELPVQKFCREVWSGREIWRGDIDRQIDQDGLQFLSSKTGIAYGELFSMTLRAHEQYACPSSANEDSARALYFRSGNSDHAIRFCPACLTGREPYYRLEWRLAFMTACSRHGLPLLECCDYCKSPCLFANVDVDRPFGSCYRCHASLSRMGKAVDEEMALQVELHLEFQKTVFHVLRGRQPLT